MGSPPPPVDDVTFEEPPVSEVIFSLQADPASGPLIDEIRALSDFRPRIDGAFPKAERQPPLPPAVESFDLTPIEPVIQFTQGAIPVRYWFTSTDDTRVVQVQPDRLVYNWRKKDDPYPRFDRLWLEFESLLSKFAEVADLSQAPHFWCELTYQNTIPVRNRQSKTHGQLAHILRYLERNPVRTTLPEVEDTQLQQRFRLVDDSGRAYGRMHVVASPAIRSDDQQPVYVLGLTVRGLVAATDFPASVERFFQLAHRLIVTGFVDLTTDEMHTAWRLRQP